MIIGIAGKSGAGKSYLSDILSENEGHEEHLYLTSIGCPEQTLNQGHFPSYPFCCRTQKNILCYHREL